MFLIDAILATRNIHDKQSDIFIKLVTTTKSFRCWCPSGQLHYHRQHRTISHKLLTSTARGNVYISNTCKTSVVTGPIEQRLSVYHSN